MASCSMKQNAEECLLTAANSLSQVFFSSVRAKWPNESSLRLKYLPLQLLRVVQCWRSRAVQPCLVESKFNATEKSAPTIRSTATHWVCSSVFQAPHGQSLNTELS